MTQRPEILYPLFAGITSVAGVGPQIAKNLEKISVTKPIDLVMTLPTGFIDRKAIETVKDIVAPATITVEVLVGRHFPGQGRNKTYKVMVEDAQIGFQLVFFHANKEWLKRSLPSGQRRIISGKLEVFDGLAQIVHPDFILRPDQLDEIPRFEPVYPLTLGVTKKTMRKAVEDSVDRISPLPEWIEPGLLKQKRWPQWDVAVKQVHQPKSEADISPGHPARERLAYDELLAHQMTLALARQNKRQSKGQSTKAPGKFQKAVLESLPYQLTQAQTRCGEEILADMGSDKRMYRLLQGDVGAGKTVVAFLALLTAAEAGGQGVLMAPTELLSRQHYATLLPWAKTAGVGLELLTGRDKGKVRQQKLANVHSGKVQILLGTHAVIQKDVVFKDLRLAIVDEQHRFGVRQRLDLAAKGRAPDILVMTATPIPRSLALAQFGDMDVSILNEKPAGRHTVDTVLVSNGRKNEVLQRLKSAMSAGRQAYWVCPLVEESERLALTAARDRFEMLSHHLGEKHVGLVHGQLPAAEKDAAMEKFVSGEVRVLVATSVIEVGMDVPTASIMVIEQAENFGLAQLHQLRGRVGRGSEKSACLLLYTPPLSATARKRLEVMRASDDGFFIAEQDLALRGAGDVLGVQQSGMPRFRIADLLVHSNLLKTAHNDARMLLTSDTHLTTQRGKAVKFLLHLMEKEEANSLLSAG